MSDGITYALDIVRRQSTDFGTPGAATLMLGVDTAAADFKMDTLELPWLGNKTGVSCIKADTYEARRVYSEHFKRFLWRLEDKHGRVACEIHNGNLAGDVTKKLVAHNGGTVYEQTQVHGCTLAGRGYGLVELPAGDGTTQYGILSSKATLDAFMEATKGADILTVTYRWAEGCAPADDI